MYLPGTPNELIGDLRRNMGISQQELSRRIGIPTSQISRLESGRIKNISSDILVKLAKEFKVSTDYILGLSTIRNRKNHDISELGLSDGAVTPLLKGKIDAQTLNRLLEHRNFPNLIKLIKIYFEDTLVAGIRGRNEIIDMAVMSLVDFKKDAQDDINLLKSQKLGDHEAEIEKIKSHFLMILRDIKKDMESGESTGETATADMIRKIQAELADKLALIKEFDEVLSLGLLKAAKALREEQNAQKSAVPEGMTAEEAAEIEALIAKRTEARKAKDWATADAIRDALAARHIVVKDTPQGITWSVQG